VFPTSVGPCFSKDALAGNALQTKDTNLAGHTFRGQRNREETNGGKGGKLTKLGCHFDEKNEEPCFLFLGGCPIVWTPIYLIKNSCDSAMMLVKWPHMATSHAANQRLGFELIHKRCGHC